MGHSSHYDIFCFTMMLINFDSYNTGRRGPFMNKNSVVLKKRLSLLFKTNTENDEDSLFGAVGTDG